MRLRAVLLSVAIMALAAPGFSQTPLIADLSEHQIQITTGFVGTDVLLFGTVAADSHVVVVVRGPEAEAAVWRKARYAGIWVNDQRVVFQRVPTFYAVRRSAPLEEIATESTRMRHGMGAEFLPLRPTAEGMKETSPQQLLVFRAELIRNNTHDNLFCSNVVHITFLGGRGSPGGVQFP